MQMLNAKSPLRLSQTFHLCFFCKYEPSKYVHKLSWVTKSAQLWRHFIKTTQTGCVDVKMKRNSSGSNRVILQIPSRWCRWVHQFTRITLGTLTTNLCWNNKQSLLVKWTCSVTNWLTIYSLLWSGLGLLFFLFQIFDCIYMLLI